MTGAVQSRDAGEWFVVWRKGGSNPRFSHPTYEGAETEARRLAQKFPSRRWFVLKAVRRFWVNEAEDQVAALSEGEA